MARRSSIVRVGPDVAQMISRLYAGGMSIDQVRHRLGELGFTVSRSALGRHIKRSQEPCPVGVAEELAALRSSIDRLAATVAALPRELREIRQVDITAVKGPVRELKDDLAELRALLARLRLTP